MVKALLATVIALGMCIPAMAATDINIGAETFFELSDKGINEDYDDALLVNLYGVGLPIIIGDSLAVVPKIGNLDIDLDTALWGDIDTDDAVAIGLDVIYALPDILAVDLAATASFLQSELDIDGGGKVDYAQWSGGIEASYDIPTEHVLITPYVGFNYDDVRVTSGVMDSRLDDNFSVSPGVRLVHGDYALSVGGKFLNQEALVISGSLLF